MTVRIRRIVTGGDGDFWPAGMIRRRGKLRNPRLVRWSVSVDGRAVDSYHTRRRAEAKQRELEMAMQYTSKGALLSQCGQYRWRLWREWRGVATPDHWRYLREDDGSPCLDGARHPLGEPLSVLWVMLNPSTADGTIDDATIRTCVAFSKLWRYDRMDVVNLFGYRATDPRALLRLNHNEDPVGSENQAHVERALGIADMVVCAWGNFGDHLGQNDTMRGWLDTHHRVPMFRLGDLTLQGHPRHPLRVPHATQLIRM